MAGKQPKMLCPGGGQMYCVCAESGTVTIFHIILYLIRMRMKGANEYE